MKKLLITLGVTLVCVGAFAQGKAQLSVDSLHLVYFGNDLTTSTVSNSVANRGVYGPTLSLAGVQLAVDLWAGSSAGSLSKVTSITGWSTASEGRFTTTSVILPTGLPGAVTAWFQIDIHDVRVASAEAAWAQTDRYGGMTPVFSMIPGVTTYVQLWNKTAGASTWADGTFPMGTLGFGAINVHATIPEPGTFALVGLGLAGLLAFRRRS